MLFGGFYVCAIAVVAGEIVIHHMADVVKGRDLKRDFRLLLQEVCGHISENDWFRISSLRTTSVNTSPIIAASYPASAGLLMRRRLNW